MVNALGQLGCKAAFLGSIGNDARGKTFAENLRKHHATPLLEQNAEPTGVCCTLLTPDRTKTVLIHLGAATGLTPGSMENHLLEQPHTVYIEGFLLHNRPFLNAVLTRSQACCRQACLDLGQAELVHKNREFLIKIIKQHVHILFTNEQETCALCNGTLEECMRFISELCEIVVVKRGEKGCAIQRGTQCFTLPAEPGSAVETTGAGDLFAAGFLYALNMGLPLDKCGQIGNILGCAATQAPGGAIAPAEWCRIKRKMTT